MKENKLKVSFFVQAKRTDKKGLVPVILIQQNETIQ